MYCRHCGKEIGENSKFCAYCGKEVGIKDASSSNQVKKQTEQRFQDNNNQERNYNSSSAREDLETVARLRKEIALQNKKSSLSGSFFLKMFLFILGIFIIAIIVLTIQEKSSGNSSATTLYKTYSEGVLEMQLPEAYKTVENLKITSNKGEYSTNLGKLHFGGTVQYTDAEGTLKKEPYKYVIFAYEDNAYNLIYLSINGEVYRDDLACVSDMGLVTTACTDKYNDLTANTSFARGVLQVVQKDTDWQITQNEYNRIKPGMQYYEVVDIVGGYGQKMGESEVLGYKATTIIFQGNNGPASNASISFVNGVVNATAALSLK